MATCAFDARELAGIIDHTLLKPEAGVAEVVALCDEALELGVAAVCVSPSHVSLAARHAGGLPVAVVVGFPSGAHRPAAKAHEAALACAEGASELDMVIDLGAATGGDWMVVERDIAAVRQAAPRPVVLKVILETALLDGDGIDAACAAAEAAGADFVKTSTGFHPAGGASVEAVRRMAGAVGGRLGVKASGGIRSREQALALVHAGATRLGVSAARAVIEGAPRLPPLDGAR
jgi:deoxyribose-phosphate aldolase